MKTTYAIALLVVLGLITALSASVLFRAYGRKQVIQSEDVTVLVAKRDMSMGSVVALADVNCAELDSKARLPQEHLIDPHEAVGKLLAADIRKGQILTVPSLMSEESARMFVWGIDKGKQAFTISVPNSSILGGVLYPGCLVNVFSSFRLKSSNSEEAVSTPLLQAVPVIAVEEQFADRKEDKERTNRTALRSNLRITLMLDNQQVQALQLADERGSIRLTIRNPLDKEVIPADPTTLSDGKIGARPLPDNVSAEAVENPDAKKDPPTVTLILGSKTEDLKIQ